MRKAELHVPAEQAVQLVTMPPDEAKPSSQRTGEAAGSKHWWPAGQCKHVPKPVWLANVPEAHGEHDVADPALTYPSAQGWGVDDASGHSWPCGQLPQDVAPVVLANCGATHAVQTCAPSAEKVPCGHAVGASAGSAHDDPAGQLVHVALPSSEYEPLWQLTRVEPVTHAKPAGHGAHAD